MEEDNRKQKLIDALPFLVFALSGMLVIFSAVSP
jgi:hypothetical protein